MKSLINPFELLGINEKSTLKEARKAYYNIALLCHPDMGGDEHSMRTLVNAYNFVEEQLKHTRTVNENIGDKLEEEFNEFNEKVKAEIPLMRDLFDLVHYFGIYLLHSNWHFLKCYHNPFQRNYRDMDFGDYLWPDFQQHPYWDHNRCLKTI